MTSSQFCWKGPCSQQHQHTALFACDGVHQCVMLYDVVSGCEHVLWRGGVVDARKKREEANTQSNKNKKDFSQNHFFPFPFFLLFFLPLFSPDLPLFHYHSLLVHTRTYFSCFTRECVCEESKTLMMQHLIHFIVFSSFPNSLFLFFSFCK